MVVKASTVGYNVKATTQKVAKVIGGQYLVIVVVVALLLIAALDRLLSFSMLLILVLWRALLREQSAFVDVEEAIAATAPW